MCTSNQPDLLLWLWDSWLYYTTRCCVGGIVVFHHSRSVAAHPHACLIYVHITGVGLSSCLHTIMLYEHLVLDLYRHNWVHVIWIQHVDSVHSVIGHVYKYVLGVLA